MRFALCILLLTVCIVVLQCTANTTDIPESGDQRSDNLDVAVVATTTTTAAQQRSEPDKTTEDLRRGSTEDGDGQSDRQQAEAAAQAALAANTITTTTAANVVPPQVSEPLGTVQNPPKDAPAPEPKGGAARKNNDKDPLPLLVERPPEAPPVRAEAKEAAAQTTKTTTASVKSDQLPDNSQTEVQTPRTTTAVQTNSSPPSTREREVAPGGPEPGKKNVGAQEKTTGDQNVSGQRGASASVPAVKDAAVTPPTSITKKNNGDNAEVQLNTNSKDKDTHQKQTPDVTTTTTEEQKASTETSTTSSAAPTKEASPAITYTLPKGFKIPQSVDKPDGIGSVSLWFAFATLVMFAVTAVTPVH